MAVNSQILTQFTQTALVGQQDMTVNNNILPVRINPSSSGGAALVAGQAFKLVAGAGAVPIVDVVTGVTDTPWGVAIHSMKRDTFLAGEYIDLAIKDSVVYLQASAAIARGAKVQLDPTTGGSPTVSTLSNPPNNAALGYSLDVGAGAGAMVRIYINPQDPNIAAY